MHQTTFRTSSASDADRIIIPVGIVRLVREGFRRYGFDTLLNSFKEGGAPLDTVIENLCIACLSGNYSMNDWDQYVNRSELRKEYFCGPHDIRRWTLERGLSRIGIHLEEVVDHVTKVCRTIGVDGPTHAYVDGSHIRRYGPKGSKVKYGEGGGTIQLQNQFMLASYIGRAVPVAMSSIRATRTTRSSTATSSRN